MKVAIVANGHTWGPETSDFQTAITHRSACEGTVKAAKSYLKTVHNSIGAAVDFTNAYNTMFRSAIGQAILDKCPGLASVFLLAYTLAGIDSAEMASRIPLLVYYVLNKETHLHLCSLRSVWLNPWLTVTLV